MSRSRVSSFKPTQTRLVWLILAMIVVIPFVATPADTRVHGLAALAFEGLSILALALLLWNSRWRIDRKSISSFIRTGVNLPILLYLGLCTASYIASPLKGYSAQELLRIVAGVLIYFAVAYQFKRSAQLSLMVNTLMVVSAGAAVIGFMQYIGGEKDQAAGLFGDHQLLGSFLMLMLPIIAMVAITERSRTRQLLAQITVVLIATSLLLSQARSAWIGAGCSLVVLGCLSLYCFMREKTKMRTQNMVASAALVVSAVVIFFLLWPQADSILSRFSTLQHVGSAGNWQARLRVWHGALEMVRQRPITGFGLGLYPYYQAGYTHTGVALHLTGGRGTLTEQAHNIYLQTAADLGIPGLLLMLAIPITFFVVGGKSLLQMHSGVRRSLLLGSMASLVAFTVDAFASPSWQFGQISMFLWLILGLGASCAAPGPEKDFKDALVPAAPDIVKRPTVAMACLALAALLPSAVLASNGSRYSSGSGSLTSGSDSGSIVAGVLGGTVLTSSLVNSQLAPPVIADCQEIEVIVSDHRELYWRGSVGLDGKINYPPLGQIQAAGVKYKVMAAEIHQMLLDRNKIAANDKVTVKNAGRSHEDGCSEIEVTVSGHQPLHWIGQIDQNGKISYPPLGTLQVSGVRLKALAAKIHQMLEAQNKIQPDDSVTVKVNGRSSSNEDTQSTYPVPNP